MHSHRLQYGRRRSHSQERLTVAGHGASRVPVSCPHHHSSCIRCSLLTVPLQGTVRSRLLLGQGARDSRRLGGGAVQLATHNMQDAAALPARQHLSSHPCKNGIVLGCSCSWKWLQARCSSACGNVSGAARLPGAAATPVPLASVAVRVLLHPPVARPGPPLRCTMQETRRPGYPCHLRCIPCRATRYAAGFVGIRWRDRPCPPACIWPV